MSNYTDQPDPASAIGRDYRIRDGRIRSFGKFEMERRYMPLFYEIYLDGLADELPGGVLSVEVVAADRKNFPELKRRKRVRFVIWDDGSVREI